MTNIDIGLFIDAAKLSILPVQLVSHVNCNAVQVVKNVAYSSVK